jgi:PPM family protein phosphatase
MRLRVGAGTDTGRVRSLNEDAFMLRAEQGLFVVCDGIGGSPAGEVASQMAVDAILARLDGPARRCAGAADHEAGYMPHTNRLAEAIRRSNRSIYDEALRDPSRAEMGTTIVGAWIRQHIASIAHVGDSRAYLWHRGRLEPLTSDHALEEGGALLRALGREADVDVELQEVAVQPGDYLLLCSDGLTRLVPDAVLAEAIVELREPQRICDYLIGAANESGGTDNITIVVVEVADAWWRWRWNRRRRKGRPGHHAETDSAV